MLIVAERRRRINAEETDEILSQLFALPITTESGFDIQQRRTIAGLGREYRLSAYDAAYLELAVRLGIPLATLDGRLKKAARPAGAALKLP